MFSAMISTPQARGTLVSQWMLYSFLRPRTMSKRNLSSVDVLQQAFPELRDEADGRPGLPLEAAAKLRQLGNDVEEFFQKLGPARRFRAHVNGFVHGRDRPRAQKRRACS